MSFLMEYKKLLESEPVLSVHVWKSENSDYCDQIDGCRNGYLCFNNRLCEDCMYSFDSRWNKNCSDISYLNHCELCFECLDCEGCYNCDFCQDSENCTDCEYLYDCRSCRNCFGCSGLRHKSFCVFNEQFSKEEYFERIKGILHEEAVSKLEKLREKLPCVAVYSLNAENSFGNYIVNSKNSYYSFKVHQLEDCFYMYDAQKDKDCMDLCAVNESELCYNCMENTMLYNCNCMYWCANCVDCEYLSHCFDCENCFGCVNLKHKKFCILNKQYEEAAYRVRVAEIKKMMCEVGEYGKFWYN